MKKIIIIGLLFSSQLQSGTFIFAGEGNGVDIVTHPAGYQPGSTSSLEVKVCIDPTGTETTKLEVSVKNIVSTFNKFEAVQQNITSENDVPFSDLDWESVVLHEVGHCLGLGHPNLGYQVEVIDGVNVIVVDNENSNYTSTTKGADGVFDLNAGSDTIKGSSDDQRDDDVNLLWFNKNINNPFVGTPPYDSTTYSRNLNDLPNGHNFVANADRTVGNALGFPNSEAVMQQGTFNNEAQRELGVDDVATLRLGMSGVDMIAGTTDDYTFKLSYGGISNDPSCNINIKHFDTSGIGVCKVGGSFLNNKHLAITEANIEIGSNFNWHFNQKLSVEDEIFKNGFDN